MNKREMIERALGRYLKKGWVGRDGGHHSYDTQRALKALAEQAIVIECEVEHRTEQVGAPPAIRERVVTGIRALRGRDGYNEIELPYKDGTPGKATAIIVSLEEK